MVAPHPRRPHRSTYGEATRISDEGRGDDRSMTTWLMSYVFSVISEWLQRSIGRLTDHIWPTVLVWGLNLNNWTSMQCSKRWKHFVTSETTQHSTKLHENTTPGSNLDPMWMCCNTFFLRALVQATAHLMHFMSKSKLAIVGCIQITKTRP